MTNQLFAVSSTTYNGCILAINFNYGFLPLCVIGHSLATVLQITTEITFSYFATWKDIKVSLVAVALVRQREFQPTVSHQECSACGRMHSANWFHARHASPSGISFNCKACMSFMTRNWQECMQRIC